MSIEITGDNNGVSVLDLDSKFPKLRKRAKARTHKDRHQKINISFANKVVIRHVRIALDGSRLEVIGHEHFLKPQVEHIRPSTVEVVGYYERPRKQKILYRYRDINIFPPANIHCVLKGWKRIFAIDTNTREVDGVRVSATSVIQAYVIDTVKGVGTYKIDTYYTRAAANVAGNPETHAICDLISKVSKEFSGDKNSSFGIITDSELGLIDKYNARTESLLPGVLLPENFHMMYATADAARDTYLPNKLMSMCDRAARKALATAKIRR